jgi:hypothetical protein
MYLRNVILAAIALTTAAFAQPLDTSFQVKYAANLNIGESYINVTNTGANGCSLLGPGFGAVSGNICVNAYAIDPGEELLSCCSCLITCDSTVNLGAKRDLISNTLTGESPTSITVKLFATLAGTNGSGTSCTNSAANIVTATAVNGMAAWGTTLHLSSGTAPFVTGSYVTTETAFTPSTISAAETASLGGRCAAIIGNASGFGICSSCRSGALGSSSLNN